ncbi:MAG: Fic family protein [Campylobacteraceae bacterium]|jgi:cell filamentation protein|nr:Fic family protein [Campylobacteraceae bacterium]
MSIYTDKLLNSNLVGAKTIDELFKIEKEITQQKVLYLRQYPIKGNFDFQHLKDIHKFIFEDIYSTAGKDRAELGFKNISFGKNDGIFNKFVDELELNSATKKMFDDLKDKNFLKDLNFHDFNKQSAEFFIKLNELHPFLKGNGRTQRIFMRQLAKEASYDLNLSITKREDMINACSYAKHGNKTDLIVLFIKACKPIEQNSKIRVPIEKNIGKER